MSLVEGRIVAHAAWRPLWLRSGSRRLLAAGIGLVTTDPAWRGQGRATRLVAACVAAAAQAGCEVALLFAERRELYARLGFRPVGREWRTRFVRACAPGHPGVRELRAPDPAALLALLETQPLRVERDAREQALLLAIPGARVFALERDGDLRAYCVVGKGRDLVGVVHEWAGAPDAVRALVESVAAREGPLCLLSPGWSEPPVAGESESVALAQGLALGGGPSARERLGDPETPALFPTYVWGLDSF